MIRRLGLYEVTVGAVIAVIVFSYIGRTFTAGFYGVALFLCFIALRHKFIYKLPLKAGRNNRFDLRILFVASVFMIIPLVFNLGFVSLITAILSTLLIFFVYKALMYSDIYNMRNTALSLSIVIVLILAGINYTSGGATGGAATEFDSLDPAMVKESGEGCSGVDYADDCARICGEQGRTYNNFFYCEKNRVFCECI